MSQKISAAEAKARIHAGGEFAFLDVREAGEFGEGHPFLAVPAPYSTLEIVAPGLMPRRDVEVILIDGGDGVADRAASRLAEMGYSNVATIEGSVGGWQDAGYTLFKGVNVPSKTLGELAEEVFHPKMIGAETLRQWRAEGRDFAFYDTRPPAEYSKMRVPGSICLPNGELVHRHDAVRQDTSKPILITCAGRTRGIIGAVGLKLAGIDNVYALENGTQGWALAGEALERGNKPEPYPDLSPAEAAASAARAENFAARENIRFIDAAGFARLASDQNRTLYLFDVRSADEFAAGHVEGAVHALGVQLVQSTDQWVGVRNARIVLADDTGMRAALAAYWLARLGYETFVLRGRDAAGIVHAAPVPPLLAPLPPISPEEAMERQARGAVLLDLRSSQAHRAGAPVGAMWAIRPRLDRLAGGAPREVLLLGDDPRVATLAAPDLVEAGTQDIALIEGGSAAWTKAGLPVEIPGGPSDAEAIDFLVFVHDRHDGNLESSRRYLAWEQGLLAQLDAAERAVLSL